VNRLIHVFFSVITCIFGHLKTATDTVVPDVRISDYNLSHVDKADMKMPNSKTDMIISTNSLLQHVFHVMYKLFPLKVILYITSFHTIKVGILVH
jgi:hypothetical protein